MDYSVIVGAVAWADVIGAIAAVAVLWVVPLVVKWGSRLVLSTIESPSDSYRDRDGNW